MRLLGRVATAGGLAGLLGAPACGTAPTVVLGDGPGCPAPEGAAVVVEPMDGGAYAISNGLFSMEIGASGQVTGLSEGNTALMASGQTMYLSSTDANGERIIDATAQSIVRQSAGLVELSFVDDSGSMNWDLHYVVQSGLSGFYYFLVADTNGKAAIVLPELRTVHRFDPTILSNGFEAERHGALPSASVAASLSSTNEVQDNAWELPGDVLLPGTPGPEGPVFTSYDWTSYVTEDAVTGHGLYGNGFGAWLLMASLEYVTGGPLKQELTVDKSNAIYNFFSSAHFGTDVTATTPDGWQKVYGPALVYLNAGTDAEVIADAEARAAAERASWPYCWMNQAAFPVVRSTVTGTVAVTHGRSAAGAFVALADPTELYGQAYGYMYATHADDAGAFAIRGVRPGTYAVHVFAAQGDIVDDVAAAGIDDGGDDGGVLDGGDDGGIPDAGGDGAVADGGIAAIAGGTVGGEVVATGVNVVAGVTNLGTLVWDPPYHPNTLWVLGSSDRTAGEFLVASATASDTLREYGPSASMGVWEIPPAALTYTIGSSTPSEDWYFAQSSTGTWKVVFGLDAPVAGSAYLTLALASVSNDPELAVTVNGRAIFDQTFGNDGTIYRSDLTSGRYQVVVVPFPGSYLTVGSASNTLALSLTANGAGSGIMYDVIKLETD